ncbi:hypothetical protein [Bacillus atrophaeus]|uniref:hypothetical protein n=1 Tax=Bacillus atrophaeus TaxID=1452 RepID=UPI002DC0621D|nr:hypothetical protein [Bacillus atrophaeus]MEC0765730.1 hypothetical protein [Bacillus atrophaeus]MEC0781503.1 hypothetical protein [Bacillus atrophaeus]MEC0810152.1 hypothetical protein [Bacillus atrophaeus]
MEWGKVFDLLKTILTSWPLAAVVIIFAIRKSLKTVIENRLFSFKVGNVEVTFDRLLEEVDESLNNESQSPDLNEDSTTNDESNENKVTAQTKTAQEKQAEKADAIRLDKKAQEIMYNIIPDLIPESPEKAMKRSWSMVVRELRALGAKYTPNHEMMPTKHAFYTLIKCEVLSLEVYKALENLDRINSMVHSTAEYKWTEEDAWSYYKRCRSAYRKLKRLNDQFLDN